jgi:2'-5' RNA ligase
VSDPEQAQAAKPLRLFFALWPDGATRAALADWGQRMQRAAGGRTTRADAIHLTLAFLGATDRTRLAELEAVARRVRPRQFEFVLDEPGFWTHNRLAWVGARRSPAELGALVADLRTALLEARFPFDPKPFVPHLTLVRKARAGGELPALEPVRWFVRDFVLVRSIPGAGGSEYVIQARLG